MIPIPKALSQKARDRALFMRKSDRVELTRPWIVKHLKFKSDDRRFYVVIPRTRLRDFEGEKLPSPEALIRAEGIWAWIKTGAPSSHFIGMNRLLCSPVPKSHDDDHGSDRRKYCNSHCCRCGLHFSSNAAFDQHVAERHRHPSKSEKLQPLEGRDTGCHNVGVGYGNPLGKYLPDKGYDVHYLPGVRIWEHVNASGARDYFGSER